MKLAFEWDEQKARANLAKHGVSFAVASRIFRNEMLERVDDGRNYGETRWIAIGHFNAAFYRVVFTWRGKQVVRLISAQKANKHEQAAYYRQIHDERN